METHHLTWPALFLITWAVFWQARAFPFLTLDDNVYVTQNPRVLGGLTAENVRWAWTTVHAANWHPLTWLSLMADAQFWGTNAGGFHLTNLALHTLNVWLLFALLWRMTGAWVRSAFVAALFAVHPLHVESVVWIAERKDVLSTLFGFLALHAWVQHVRRGGVVWYATTFLALLCSLLSKQMLVTFPFLLLLLDYWPLDRVAARSPLQLAREKAPLFVLVVLFCVVAVVVQKRGGAVKPLADYSILTRGMNAVVAYALYLQKAVWPAGLAVLYPHPERGISLAALAAAALLLAGLTAGTLAGARRWPFLPVGWFWYLGTLVPVIGLVQIGDQQMADRYTYLPLIGPFIAVVWLAPAVVGCGAGRGLLLHGTAAATILACAVIAHRQTRLWADDITLLEHALAVTRDNDFAHNNLAAALLDEGRTAEALTHFEEAVRVRPSSSTSQRNLGIMYYKLGRLVEAEPPLQQAIVLQPDDGFAHLALGALYRDRGDLVQAGKHLFLGVSLRPYDSEAHYLFGLVSQSLGDLPTAEEHLARAAALQPDMAETHNDLGVVQLALGKRDAAVQSFREALQRNPNFKPAQENLRQVSGGEKAGAPSQNP